MFGTFICSLFTEQKLWSRGNPALLKDLGRTNIVIDSELKSDQYNINAHRSAYNDTLHNFHDDTDSLSLLKKNNDELINFFKPLQSVNLGIHRLATYKFLKINFKKYFSRFVIVLVKPNLDRLDIYGERFDKALEPNYQIQWWAKNFKRKNLNKVPKFFLEKMSIKEKQKFIKSQTDWLNNFTEIDQKNTIVFDPDDIVNPNLLQQMTDQVCNSLEIENFQIPFSKIQRFVDKNKKYLK